MHIFNVNSPIAFGKHKICLRVLYKYRNYLITDSTWFENVSVDLRGLEAGVEYYSSFKVTRLDNRVAWALKAMTLTDLTTLSGDDAHSNVERLCIRACFPFFKNSFIENHSINTDFLKKLHVAAVCVYPSKVKDAYETLKKLNMLDTIQIASGNSYLWDISRISDININILLLVF